MSTHAAVVDEPVIDAPDYLARHEAKDLLRFITCGSVDDGKSTLIGRLLYDSRLVLEDQLSALVSDSVRHGTVGEDIDFALLVDGLEAERQQGITIDVAYRFFTTDRRKFIVADTPGHVQYTRNMATGASTADLAILLVDARKGILTQTRRHAYIAALFGIRHVVLAINKIDLVDDAENVFESIVSDWRAFSHVFSFETVTPIPISARFGDNVTTCSDRLRWYDGPVLLKHLETVPVAGGRTSAPFRMPVQWVNRPNLDFRGYSGTVAGGTVSRGEKIAVLPSGRTARIERIVTFDGDLDSAGDGDAVTLVLDAEIDVSRGDVISSAAERPAVADQFSAHVVWMHDDPLIPGRPYLFKIGTRMVVGSVTDIRHEVDVDSFEVRPARTVALNGVAVVHLSFREQIAFDPYARNPTTGGFIVIDRLTSQTLGAGIVDFALRRAENVHWQAVDVTKAARGGALAQRPAVLWFTGLSGAGKSTIANLVEKRLFAMHRHTYLLDGDNVRHGLCRDLGFTEADRVENVRRVAETARLFVDAGLIVLCSFISPYRAERQLARELLDPGEFIEIFVDTPLHVAEKRDPKGLYRKARDGAITNFTGIDSPYEPPERPELSLAAGIRGAVELADDVIAYLDAGGHLR